MEEEDGGRMSANEVGYKKNDANEGTEIEELELEIEKLGLGRR